jgi:hypothetical protein
MNVRSISLIICFFVGSLTLGWSQISAPQLKMDKSAHQIMRNAEQTYVHLQWVPITDATSYEVRIRNLADRDWQYFTTTSTNFTVPNLDVPAVYEWTIVPMGIQVIPADYYSIKQFSTRYNTAQKVDRQVFSMLMEWDGTAEEKMTLGQFMRANRPDNVSPDVVETFIQNYYGGNEPESIGDETCNCEVFLQDNFIPDPQDDFPPITEASYIRYGTANGTGGREKLGSSKYHQRKTESNYIVSYGAAKDMRFNLEGRMNDGQWQQHYTDAKTDHTFIVAKFVCTGLDCGDCQDEQRFDVWAKYIVDMQFTEWLAGPGEYAMSTQDATMFMEIDKNGVTNIGEQLAGIMREKDVSLNPDLLTNWINTLQTTTELANSIFNFIPGTDEDTPDGQQIIDDIFNVVENWVNAINTPSYVTNVNEGIDITSDPELWKHQTCIAPNDWKCFAVLSTGKIGYTKAWGKKGISVKSWKNVPADIKISGYLESDIGMSISSVYNPYPQPDECANGCCFNSMGKWLYYSMRGADFDVRKDIRGLFNDIGWEYADDFLHFDNPPVIGDPVDFYQGNAVLNPNFALITDATDCCEADPLDMSLGIQVDCVEVPCDGGPQEPQDDKTSSSFIPDPPNPGDPCYKLDITIQVQGNLDLNHILQIFRYHESTGSTLAWSNWTGQSPTGQYTVTLSPYYPESIYYVVHKVEDSCGKLVSETFPLTINCDKGGDDGGYDDSPGSPDGDFLQAPQQGTINTTTGETMEQPVEADQLDPNNLTLPAMKNDLLHFDVFPNPATDVLNIRFAQQYLDGNAVIEIFSTGGQLVKTLPVKDGNSVQAIEVNDIVAGMYLVRVSNAKGMVHVKRVVIQ